MITENIENTVEHENAEKVENTTLLHLYYVPTDTAMPVLNVLIDFSKNTLKYYENHYYAHTENNALKLAKETDLLSYIGFLKRQGFTEVNYLP